MKHRNRRNRYLPITGIVIFSFGGLLLVNSTTASADAITTATVIKNTQSATPAKSQTSSSAFSVSGATSSASIAKISASNAKAATSITSQPSSSSVATRPSTSAASGIPKSNVTATSSASSTTSQTTTKPVSKAAPVKTAVSNIQPSKQTSSITPLSATAPSTATTTTNTGHYLTLQMANVPAGLYFKTGKNYVATREFTNGNRLYLSQMLSPNTTWEIKQVATDDQHNTFYNIGANEWVPDQESYMVDFDNNAPQSTQFTPAVPVNNSFQNSPIVSELPLTFHLDQGPALDYEEFSLPAIHDLRTTYTGSNTFTTHAYYIDNNDVMWLNVNQNVWIDLAGGYDYITQQDLSITPFPASFLIGVATACSSAVNGMNTMVSALKAVNNSVVTINSTLASTQQPLAQINTSLDTMNTAMTSINKNLSNLNASLPGVIQDLTTMQKGINQMNTGVTQMNTGMKQMISALYGTSAGTNSMTAGTSSMINAVAGMNTGISEAVQGESGMISSLEGADGLIQTVQGMTTAIQIANLGVSEMQVGQSIMNKAFKTMNAGTLLVNDSISRQIAAIAGANETLGEMTKNNASNLAAIDKFNAEIQNLNVGAIESTAASTYSPSTTSTSTTGLQNAVSSLSSFFNTNSNQFVVFPISDATKQKFEQSMNTSAQLLNALSFFTHGTVEVVGGAAAGITGIAGVMSGGALVTLDTGGVGILALPGTVVLAGGAIVAASGATIASGLADISQGIQVAQFHNGDRPESRTYGQVQGKYNGKNVTYRVDAEPQGKKLQVQINGDKSFDARLNADEIHSIQDAINKMPDKLVKNLTSGNLQTLAKYIYKAAQSLNS